VKYLIKTPICGRLTDQIGDYPMTDWKEGDRYPGYSDQSRPIGPARFFFWPERAILLGAANDIAPHAHHILQVAVGLDGAFVLQTPGKNYECRSVVIAPNQVHRFLGRGNQQMIVLLDTESAVARILRESICKGSPVAEFDIKILHPFIEELGASAEKLMDGAGMRDLSRRMLSALAGQSAMPLALDPRIQSALDFMKRQEDLRAPLRLVAEAVGLSEGRLTHLFSEEVGIPMRRYLLWLSLVRADGNLCDGESLTTSAHNAGFADSAHLSRTFRRMFGVTPSGLFKNSQFVQVITSPD
jgi:AraC-like DNA-binding protein